MQTVRKGPRDRNGLHNSLHSVMVAYHEHLYATGVLDTLHRYLNCPRYMGLRKCLTEIVKTRNCCTYFSSRKGRIVNVIEKSVARASLNRSTSFLWGKLKYEVIWVVQTAGPRCRAALRTLPLEWMVRMGWRTRGNPKEPAQSPAQSKTRCQKG